MPDYLQIALRALISYIFLLLLTRLMGKREISQLTFFDYCVGITIGSITSIMSTETSTGWYNILPALIVFGLLQIITSYLSMKSKVFRQIMEGKQNVLIRNGRVLEKNMLKSRINTDELLSKLRQKNAFKIADVETAILETDGKFSVQLKSNKQPITPYMMNIKTQYNGLPALVIEEGKVSGENLKNMKLTRSWLMSKLAEQGIYDISNVMLAQVDTSGNLYMDLYNDSDNKPNKSQSKELILAKLEKIKTDLNTYSLDTDNEDAKKLYKECEASTKVIINQFKKYMNQQS